MVSNYLKTGWRNLWKNKVFSAINILGLSIGIAVFLLIMNYLRFQFSFDDGNTNKDRIFRIPMKISEKGEKEQTFAFTYPAVAPAMKNDFPEVQEAFRIRKRWGIVQRGDQKFIENAQIFSVDASIFNTFSFEFQQGNPATALKELNDAVITKTTALKYYGKENPVGKTFHYNNEDYVVTAVIKDMPANSHLQFHILLNYEKYIQQTQGNANTSWGWSDFYTYILLKPTADAKALQAKMPAFAEKHMGSDMKKFGFQVFFQLQPLKEIHTNSVYDYEMEGSGNLYYLKYLGIAALIILLIALTNYINLSTARSLERSKEVGVRKVIGATRPQLVRQFIAETFLMNLFAILIGFLLFKLALPVFSRLIEMNVLDLQTKSWQFWGVMAGVFLISTLLASFYPAFVLSSFQPIQSLKSFAGTVVRSKNYFRKSLVVLQFAAAIILIGGAIGFYQQLKFMSSRDLGVKIKQTLVLQQNVDLDSSKLATVESFMNDLKNIAGVESVTASTDVPGGELGNSTSFSRPNSTEEKRCRTLGVDEKFIPNFGLTLAAGRAFDKDKPPTGDTTQILNVILNETASNILGFKEPKEAIDKIIVNGNGTYKIIGVIHDYHQESLQYAYDPTVIYPGRSLDMGNFSLKLNTTNTTAVVEKAKQIWDARFPESPFQFVFADERFNAQYKNDNLFSTVLWWFTLLAIIVASLGLFGLSLYTIAKRTKEISVRKVLGASVIQITALMTKDYIKLVLIAGVVAIPVAYFILKNWLKDYAFHVEIGIWFFVLPLLLIVVIALLTVMFQSVKAALTNPVKSLRSE